MEIILLATVLFLLFALGAFGFYFFRKIQELLSGQNQQTGFQLLNQNVLTVHQRLDHAAQVIQTLAKEVSAMQEIGRSMRSLQDFLKGPKLRGALGEQILNQILEQYLPRQQFELQYRFVNGQIVDAIVKTSQGLIPIDAKFPLENFQRLSGLTQEDERERAQKDFVRDVKKHIQDIAKKYIMPAQGTVDFALLYIPSEAVYYEVTHLEEDLNQFARHHRVFPVSPNSFLYFLRILLLGMEGMKIEASSRQILKLLSAIHQDAERLGAVLSTATAHITNAKNTMERVNTEYSGLISQFNQIRLLESGEDEKQEQE